MTSTLIKGGKVYDHATNEFERADVLIRDETVVGIGHVEESADNVMDAGGMLIAAGFIDLHCHIFDHPLFRTTRLQADRIGIGQGVVCLVDTGSAGPTTIDAFKEFVIDTQETATFALCNVGSPGLPGIQGGHSSRPELVSLSETVKAVERNSDWIVGVKVLASSSHTGLMGLEAVKIGRKAAELTGTPLMVHIGNAPPVIEDILALLRPGDIVTHAYHGKVGGVLDRHGRAIPEFRAAVERGVIVDIGHGRSSFSFSTCEQALAQDMPVHTISSDLHMGNVDRYVVSLARTMSKFRLLGLPLEDVVNAVTRAPAEALGLTRSGFGNLHELRPANITIFAETDKEVDVEDAEGEVRRTTRWIEPKAVFVNGKGFEVTGHL